MPKAQNHIIHSELEALIERLSHDQGVNSEELHTLEQILSFKDDLIVISPFKNHSLYYQAAAFSQESDLTLVISPVSSLINKELGLLKSIGLGSHVAALTSDLFPNQARKIIAETAEGAYRILFMTPESFLYWFSSGFNSMAIEHYRKLAEDDLGKQVFINTQLILERVTRIALREFDLINPENGAHKPKYLEAVNLIRELNQPILALSFNSSQETINHFLRYFPNTPIIYEELRLPKVSLKAKYCFSRLDKQKHLLKLLKTDKPTLIYVSPHEDLAELVNYLRNKLPDLSMKAFHKGLPTEQKAEALDYFLNHPQPVFITTSELTDGINRTNISRLIHFSPPNSLADYYKDIHILNTQDSQSESHLLLCEDDLKLNSSQESKLQSQYNRDGLVVKREKLTGQLLQWVSDSKGCRWQNLEKILNSNVQQQVPCGICDLCLGEKNSFFSAASLFFLKKSFS